MRIRYLLIAATFVSGAIRADVTIRYKRDLKAVMPMPVTDGTEAIYMKGNKGSSASGDLTTIMDFARQEITLIDTVRKKYATVPASEYGAKIAVAVPQAGAGPGSVKTKADSRKTGRTEVILGIQAEEREDLISMEMPMPAGAQGGMTMKLVTDVWTAAPGESLRVPAIRQLTAGFNLWQKYFMNPAEMIGRAMPGMASLVEEMSKDQSVILRTNMAIYMSSNPAAFMEMKQEVVEISTAPLDDSLFRIPQDCSAAPFEEVFGGMVQAHLEQAKSQMRAPANVSVPANIKAYVPSLSPLRQTQPVLPEAARAAGVQGMVELLVTVDPQGNVSRAEALTGPEILRKIAIDAVCQGKYQPVVRNGAPVFAYPDATVDFIDWKKGADAGARFMADGMQEAAAASQRRVDLEQALPRSPQQVLADLEQQAGGGDRYRRYVALNKMAAAALDAGASDKAAAYARELLTLAQAQPKDWNYGNAIHDGHTTLGLLAAKNNDIDTARRELLEAGKTPGSPQLNSFGPNMALANELLRKGEKEAVLEYFTLCRAFWKMGAERLDSWSETVRNGGNPVFGVNLR